MEVNDQFKFSCSEALVRAVGGANVTEVSVYDCEFEFGSFIRMLKACTSLQTLRLMRFMDIDDLIPLASKPVAVLDLATACPSITELEFASDGMIDDGEPFLAGLTCLTRLERLKLTFDDKLDDFGYSGFPEGARLTPAAVDVLLNQANFPRLVELELNIKPATGVDMVETLQRIVDARPALRILTVDLEHFPDYTLEETFVMPFEATLKERGGEFRFEDYD